MARNFLIMLNNLLKMHLERLQKEQFKKQQKTKASRASPQNSSVTVERETKNIIFDREVLKERYTKYYENTKK